MTYVVFLCEFLGNLFSSLASLQIKLRSIKFLLFFWLYSTNSNYKEAKYKQHHPAKLQSQLKPIKILIDLLLQLKSRNSIKLFFSIFFFSLSFCCLCHVAKKKGAQRLLSMPKMATFQMDL